ncbi:MAG: CDP-diacylglycerol--serine O-phosphatidyltransferase [Bacteroidales bacterium]|nr:CDP-diacylglycerol--serine O-phosphatidyltransferase [Bacteroidales bacterium]
MKVKIHIPNAITLLNLLSGCFSIVSAFEGDLIGAAYFIFLAAILDFMDGTFARILNARTEIGKQLDSLADMVSFGLAPGFILFHLINNSLIIGGMQITDNFLPFIAFLIPVFSAVRLAKFNIDTEQENSFIGLPTPANAILIASFPLILFYENENSFITLNILQNLWVLISVSVLLSVLLIAKLPLMSLKFKTLKFSDNLSRYIFMILSIVLLIGLKFHAIPLVIFLYIAVSVGIRYKGNMENNRITRK